MKIYIIKKCNYRIYKSEEIVQHIFGETLSYDEKGAPKLQNQYISISDTKNYWLCVLSPGPVGLDAEEKRRSVKESVANRLHYLEKAYLEPLPLGGSEWKEEFLKIWVKKEAYMKLSGEGLRMGLSSFSVIDTGMLPDDALKDCLEENLKIVTAQAFEYKNLFIGLAGEVLDYEVEEVSYDAPFEKSAAAAAMELLNMRSYSRLELLKKLLDKGYAKDDAEKALDTLCEKKYIDDEYYARQLAERYFSAGKAPFGIENELVKKGIERELAHTISLEYEERSFDKALEIASKYDVKDEKDIAKICRKLASYGYKQSVVYDIIKRLKL